MKLFLQLLCVVLFISSCKNSSSDKSVDTGKEAVAVVSIPDSLTAPIDTIIKNMALENKCRITMKIANDSGGIHYSGYDGRANQIITDFNRTIDIGSCTKMFTATSILQLVEQNKLSLDDKLTSVLPNDTLYKDLLVINGKDYIDSVKIVNLLNHSSGFPEYFIDGDDDKEIALHGDSSLRFTPYELINLSKEHKKDQFIPGTSFKYCNVNYLLLGLIIEKLSGQTYQQYFKEHIIDVLGMKHTYFASLNSPADRSPGHFKGKISMMPATLAGAAGEIISTLDDMVIFISAWNKGKLFATPGMIEKVKVENYREMGSGSGIHYGMGVVNLMNLSFGHGGQTFGFQSFIGGLTNNYSFALGIDDASVSSWLPAIKISSVLHTD